MEDVFREGASQRAVYEKLKDVNDRLECYLEWCSTGEVGSNYNIEPMLDEARSFYNTAGVVSISGYTDKDLSEEMERTEQAVKQIMDD